MNDKVPAISVIVPLYNAEEYIEQCLGSILNQTFKDYEVIVIDDCSTDNSVAVVEKFATKFKGKLRLIRKNKNSGGPAISRNIGIGLAKGKYIAFIDNDDLFIPNALKDFYEVAEKFKADVVHAEKHFRNVKPEKVIDNQTKLEITSTQRTDFVDKPTLDTNNLAERLIAFSQKKYWYVWNKIFRRDFLIENQIYFKDIIASDDLLFSFFTVCLAKNYVRMPQVVNLYRRREDSLSFDFNSLSIEKFIHKWTNIVIKLVKYFDEFMSQQEFFIQNPEFKYIVLELPIHDHFDFFSQNIYKKINDNQITKIDLMLQKELEVNPEDNVMLTTYLFNLANVYKVRLERLGRMNYELQQQINLMKGKDL